jgi:hypothetical protein
MYANENTRIRVVLWNAGCFPKDVSLHDVLGLTKDEFIAQYDRRFFEASDRMMSVPDLDPDRRREVLNKVPDAHVEENGPWILQMGRQGDFFLQSEDFTHDAIIRIDGDFRNAEQKLSYAKMLLYRLNHGPLFPRISESPLRDILLVFEAAQSRVFQSSEDADRLGPVVDRMKARYEILRDEVRNHREAWLLSRIETMQHIIVNQGGRAPVIDNKKTQTVEEVIDRLGIRELVDERKKVLDQRRSPAADDDTDTPPSATPPSATP